MRLRSFLLGLALVVAPAWADFTDADAGVIAAHSPAVARSAAAIATAIKALPPDMQAQTRDGFFTPDGCIAYRRNETAQTRAGVVADLIANGFAADAKALERSLYGYPAKTDAGCVHKTQAFLATPGSEANSHHAWPGGLADHTAFNLGVGKDLLARYGQITALPQGVDTAALTGAVLWHDWAKQLLLHWSDAGIVSYESPIAGTQSHHIIGLAEAMARQLPARMIVVQACAHHAPSGEADQTVANYLRAAAIIARVDPVARGYVRAVPGGFASDASPECRLNNMSDGNWVYGVPALRHAQAMLERLAPRLGYKPGEPATRRFILWALSTYGAERFDMIDDADALKLLQQLQQDLITMKKSDAIGPND